MNFVQHLPADSATHTREVTGLVLGIVVVALAVAVLVLWCAAIVSVVRSSYGFGMKVVFVLGILALPIAGSLAWFFVVKKNQPTAGPGRAAPGEVW